jgi:ABC-type histidine transport system ATPase subunit
MPLLQKIYDEVHAALWAILVAFVLWFSAVIVPMLPEIRARADMVRDHELATEQDRYCGNLGMGQKTTMYRSCISELEQYRAKIRRRIADENEAFF